MELNHKLYPLNRALFLESSPAPVKYAAAKLGRSAAEVRLPLVEVTDETKEAVNAALHHAAILH